MNQKICLEVKKFAAPPVFFTDRKKILDLETTIKNLPKNCAIIIREYDLDAKSREAFARKIIDLARPRGIKILIAKDFSLAKKIKADGLHFSDFDQLPTQFLQKKLWPKNFIFSLAAHSLKSILKLQKLAALAFPVADVREICVRSAGTIYAWQMEQLAAINPLSPDPIEQVK